MTRLLKIMRLVALELLLIIAVLAVHAQLQPAHASAAPCTRTAQYMPGHDYISGGYYHRLVFTYLDASANRNVTYPSNGSYVDSSQAYCDGNYGGAMPGGNLDLIYLSNGIFSWDGAFGSQPALAPANRVTPTQIHLGVPANSPNPTVIPEGCVTLPPTPNPPVYPCTGNFGQNSRYAAFVDDSGRLVIGGKNGNVTVYCSSLATNSGRSGYRDCPPDITSSSLSPHNGAGYLFTADQCGQVLSISSQCNSGAYTKWYQAPGYGNSGSVDLSPLIQTDNRGLGYLVGFYNHLDARNSQPGGFTVGNFYELRYPLNSGTCSFSLSPSSPAPGSTMTITVTIKNNGTKPWQNVLSQANVSNNAGYNFASAPGNNITAPGFPNTVLKTGDTYTFTVTRTAPSTTNLRWNLREDGQVITGCNQGSAPGSFDLTPTANVNLTDSFGRQTIENPANATFTSSIINNAGVAVNGINWTRDFYINKLSGNRIELTGYPANGTANMPTGNFNFPDDSKGVSGLSAGDQVCVSLLIDPGSGTVDTNSNITSRGAPKSVTRCVTVVDKPYVRFFGADLFVGGMFGTGCTSSYGPGDIHTFYNNTSAGYSGSSEQFAVYALGVIAQDDTGTNSVGFSTVAGGGSGVNPPKGLTFANTTSQLGGSFGNNNCVPDYFADSTGLSDSLAPNPLNISTLPNGQSLYRPGGRSWVTLTNGAGISNGSDVFLYIDGDTYIQNNLAYQNTSWASENDVPQLYVIVRGNIYIDSSVSALSGTYIAEPTGTGGGTIYTCSTPSEAQIPQSDVNAYLPGGVCHQNQLKVNGSFISAHLILNRTINSLRSSSPSENANSSGAAETFQFTPEIYIPAICQKLPQLSFCATSNQDDAITELPPIL